ncbi:hypothetical protein [Bradyrhizobium sp. ORS 285]|uniref:hypothetical protein n=1 Tax=Bradyrhizobium sp. ORS 285 TaxID=115808 RepID=UPI00030C1627|nr:hypothetical protein [Bradyrhizobium sp. ORS 285]
MKIAVCSTCGSDEVLADAYAAWAVTSQSWELAQTFDKGAYCARCDGQTKLVFMAIPPAQQALFEQ